MYKRDKKNILKIGYIMRVLDTHHDLGGVYLLDVIVKEDHMKCKQEVI